MTDPFYQNQRFPNSQGNPQQSWTNTQQAPQLSPQQQQQLNIMLQQEQAIIQQINQLNNILRTQQLLPQQQQQVAKQIQQYNMQLQYIAQQKQQFWIIHTNKPVIHPTTKTWNKVSFKKIIMGCFIFLILIVGGWALVFYSFIQDPDKLTSMGLTVETAKNLLKTLVSLAFGLLTFLAFGLLVVNIYRLFTVKNKSKVGNVIWAFFWIIMLVWTIAGWVNLLWKIWTISPDESINSQNLVMPYAEFKWWYQAVSENTQLIGPVNISYRLNWNVFNNQLLSKLWTIDLQKISMSLDCWNEKSLNLDLNTLEFGGKCLYVKKWKYQLVLTINYVNSQTQELMKQDVPVSFIDVKSQILVSNNWETITFNWDQTEMVMWKVPRKITFDASEVFKDFGLNNYKIARDADNDWVVDKENDSSFTFVYKKAQVYNVNFRIPELNDLLYTFPIRIEQSDVPICEITATELKGSEYSFVTDFIESNETIESYLFSIIDTKNTKIIDSVKSKNNYIKYSFPWAGTYSIQTTFQTTEWKKWSCDSDNIVVGASSFDIYYDILYKTPSSPSFKIIWDSGKTFLKENIITVSEIPTVLQIKLTKVTPETSSSSKKVIIDWEAIISLDDNVFEFTIDQNKEYDLEIVVEDSNRNMKTEKVFSIVVKRDDIIWKILIKPETVWVEPFEVTFDASVSTINDPNDEIVYFSWIFGDGKEDKNVSQAVVSHTYLYDYEKENWTYNPILSLTTKKGRIIEVPVETPIIVKKSQSSFVINIDSHPWQLAKLWDDVAFSLDLNGLPTKVVWDFGDENQLECKWRECIETTHLYTKTWLFTVKTTVYEEKKSPVENHITIKVE